MTNIMIAYVNDDFNSSLIIDLRRLFDACQNFCSVLDPLRMVTLLIWWLTRTHSSLQCEPKCTPPDSKQLQHNYSELSDIVHSWWIFSRNLALRQERSCLYVVYLVQWTFLSPNGSISTVTGWKSVDFSSGEFLRLLDSQQIGNTNTS